MTEHENYEVNFFKPLTEHAKANKRLISTLASIWAIAVFGFHFLLIIITTPTPEDTLNDFTSVWPMVVEDNSAPLESKQLFAKSMLMVLGKNIAVKDDHKAVLKESLSWSIYSMQPDSIKGTFNLEPQSAAASIGLSSEGFDKIMIDLLPSSLVQLEKRELSDKAKKELPEIMNLYLIHNQSFLTDFKFLGFPFHYWYTAQFLLILFVLLCLFYAFAIEKLNTKYKFVEET